MSFLYIMAALFAFAIGLLVSAQAGCLTGIVAMLIIFGFASTDDEVRRKKTAFPPNQGKHKSD
jgi:hypothetical protein